eukprot:449026-Amorphochlora_amoeboformis.AAC.1
MTVGNLLTPEPIFLAHHLTLIALLGALSILGGFSEPLRIGGYLKAPWSGVNSKLNHLYNPLKRYLVNDSQKITLIVTLGNSAGGGRGLCRTSCGAGSHRFPRSADLVT